MKMKLKLIFFQVISLSSSGWLELAVPGKQPGRGFCRMMAPANHSTSIMSCAGAD
jgi:hypothetical protein